MEVVNEAEADGLNQNDFDKAEIVRLRQRVAELEQANDFLEQAYATSQQETNQLRQALEQTQHERDRYHYVLLNIPAAIILSLGPEHTTDLANPLYLQIVGRDAAIKDRTIREIFPELTDQGLFELMDAVYQTGKPFVGQEVTIQLDRNGDGILSDGFYDFIYHPILTSSGQIEGVFAHAIDVTRQVKAKRTLELERRRLQEIFMNAPAAITTVRVPNYVFELANEPYMRLVGRQNSIIGLSVLEALPEVAGQGFIELLDNVCLTGEPFIGQEMPILFDRTGDGNLEQAFLNFVYQPLFAADGSRRVESIFVHVVDVTEQVRSRKQIEELSQLKDEFLSIASHDLRTPITAIKGYLQLLQRNFVKQQQVHSSRLEIQTDSSDGGVSRNESEARFLENSLRLLNTVITQSNRLNELITRLLDFSRIAQNQLRLQYNHDADLVKLVMEVVANLSMTTEQHRVLIQPPLTDSVRLSYDETRIEQVLNNLISNAIKYSPPGTTITVGIEPPQPNQMEVVVWISDEGYGISLEQQQHLFERFYRVQNDQNTRNSGLGLGLYISAEIVEQHGGRLWVESEVGKGSTFYLALPFKAIEND